MIYQLPNGKVIRLTLEEYLDLTDSDIRYLESLGAGDYASSPWYGSVIKKKPKKEIDQDPIEEDRSIDYEFETDESIKGISSDDTFIDDEFPEISDDMAGEI